MSRKRKKHRRAKVAKQHVNTHKVGSIQLNDDKFVIFTKKNKVLNPLLYDLLTKATPHKHEDRIAGQITQYIKTLGHEVKADTVGNLIVVLPKADGSKSSTIFSCHMDTVHTEPDDLILGITKSMPSPMDDGMVYALRRFQKELYTFVDLLGNKGDKEIDEWDVNSEIRKMKGWCEPVKGENGDILVFSKSAYNTPKNEWVDMGIKYTVRKQNMIAPSILGADDKVGCYIACQLIKNKTPGMYIFHVGEEKGGVGSGHIRKNTPELLEGYSRCIAFDRANYGDVIAFQGGRTASKTMTQALADAINDNIPSPEFRPYKGDVVGVWTDSANYKELVPECTNISVGYFNQHGNSEHFDPIFLEEHLLPALKKVDFDALPTERVAAPETYTNYSNRYASGASAYRAPSSNVTPLPTRTHALPYLGKEVPDTVVVKDALSPYSVTIGTPYDKVPCWDPKRGNYLSTSAIAMKRMIFKYLSTACSGKQTDVSAEIISALLRERDTLVLENERLNSHNQFLRDFSHDVVSGYKGAGIC